MFNYSIGGYGFTSFGRASNSDGLNIMTENQSIDQLNRWQKSGDLVLNPKPIWGVSTQSVMNSTVICITNSGSFAESSIFLSNSPDNSTFDWLKRLFYFFNWR